MIRLFPLSLLAVFVGTALADTAVEQQVLDTSVRFFDSWSYVNCGLPSDPIQLQSITLSPDPPKPGKDLTVTVSGTAHEAIKDGAYADVVVKLGLIKLLTKRFDVCDEARNANTTIQCPVEPGTYTVSHTVQLPNEIPRAKFGVSVRGYTVDDDDMLCLDLKVDFMKLPFPISL